MSRTTKNGRKLQTFGAQGQLFSANSSGTNPTAKSSDGCQIVAVGKRRDGGTRYWCLLHKADATAKYGKPAENCRAAHIPAIRSDETFELDLDRYSGGVALWGAVPAVYDTTRLPMDRGIHVHARPKPDSDKEMDRTFRAVRILGRNLPTEGILISELDAIYYMVSSIFNFQMAYVVCVHCGYPHLDRDWFSVHPHRRHLCAGCGKKFTDSRVAVGNPIFGVRDACKLAPHKSRVSHRPLRIRQADFPGGIQIWGSNPAFLWTGDRPEEEGIHVHAFRRLDDEQPAFDETYGEVTIDDIKLNPVMVRVLMAQSALPSLAGRIMPVVCDRCHSGHFSEGEYAFTPTATHACKKCSRTFPSSGKLRKTVGNPLLAVFAQLAKSAPRSPQSHKLELLPETL
jgi:transposase-like protein